MQALIEIPQIPLKVSLALLVGLLAHGGLVAVQLLQLGDFRLQLGKSGGGDVIGLRADLPFDWLIGLRSSVIFIDEGATHGFLPL
ncbi:hypothetical protein EMIT0P100_170100 [Pseudomonas sp. IT-P100]